MRIVVSLELFEKPSLALHKSSQFIWRKFEDLGSSVEVELIMMMIILIL